MVLLLTNHWTGCFACMLELESRMSCKIRHLPVYTNADDVLQALCQLVPGGAWCPKWHLHAAVGGMSYDNFDEAVQGMSSVNMIDIWPAIKRKTSEGYVLDWTWVRLSEQTLQF